MHMLLIIIVTAVVIDFVLFSFLCFPCSCIPYNSILLFLHVQCFTQVQKKEEDKKTEKAKR